MLRIFSHADWLTGDRARAYACLLAGAIALFAAVLVIETAEQTAATKPPALDFAGFWAAARLADTGHIAQIYDPAAINAVGQSVTSVQPGGLIFAYPPSFLVLLLPFGLFGYLAGLVAFLIAETTLAFVALRRLLPLRWGWLAVAAYPGFLINLIAGQNAALMTACFAAGAAWLQTRPLLAGYCLGVLACKPQLAFCIPLALIAARRWRALAGAAASSLCLALAGWAFAGTASWIMFFTKALPQAASLLQAPFMWPKLDSLYSAVRQAGGSAHAAALAQALLACAALAILLRTCLRRPGPLPEIGSAVCAALLSTPYLYGYDLTILALPMISLFTLAQADGWRPWEKLLSVMLFLLPTPQIVPHLSRLTGASLTPALVGALLLALARPPHMPRAAV